MGDSFKEYAMGMQISSGAASAQGGAQVWQQRRQQFQALAQAMGAHDLNAARSAYAALTHNGTSYAASDPNSPLAQLGKALQAGDFSAAQGVWTEMKLGRGPYRQAQPPSASSTRTALAPYTTQTVGNHVNVLA
jgi:hypothetical protein